MPLKPRINEKEFLGSCMGVRLVPRGPIGSLNGDRHVMVQLLVEDDGRWHPKSNPISSHWLDELINQLVEARLWLMENTKRDMVQIGSGPPQQMGFKFDP